jgi:hypothetical protein
MKQRLLVMNGQRILQTAQDSDWSNQKVDKAGELRPGIYNLSGAIKADRGKAHTGPILHADGATVYQGQGRAIVAHDRTDFGKVPEIGSTKTISYYEAGKASVAEPVQGQSRGHKI